MARKHQRAGERPYPAAIDTHGDVIFEEFVAPLLAKTKEPAEPSRANDLPGALPRGKAAYHPGTQRYWRPSGKACEILGISRPTLRQKLKEYSIPDRLRGIDRSKAYISGRARKSERNFS